MNVLKTYKKEYMPDEWTVLNVKKIEKKFFMGVLITLAPEFVEQTVLDIENL